MNSLASTFSRLATPRRVIQELNRQYHRRAGTRRYNTDGIDVFDRDWDNLIILDAFRYDLFADLIEEYDISGTVQPAISRGSATPEFLYGNLHGEKLHDTVYVTATTMLYREGALAEKLDLNLHEIVDVWQDQVDHGEFAAGTETMNEYALEAAENYSNKRLVVHYIQPHIPFVGEFGREEFADVGDAIWDLAEDGSLGVSDQAIWRAYRENGRIALEGVSEVIAQLPGKTVISSDHGQMIGDRARPFPIREYGHPSGLYTPQLVTVPWYVCDHDRRKEVVAEAPETRYSEKGNEEIDAQARDHLQQLGYLG